MKRIARVWWTIAVLCTFVQAINLIGKYFAGKFDGGVIEGAVFVLLIGYGVFGFWVVVKDDIK